MVLHPLADHRRQLPDRPARGDPRRRAGLRAGGVLQPRVPERAEGSQGLHPPAHGGHRVRLPAGRRRREDREPRGGVDHETACPCSTGSGDPAARDCRPARGGVDPGAGRRRSARRRRLGLRDAARAAVAGPLTDDPVVTAGLFEMIDAYLGDESAGG